MWRLQTVSIISNVQSPLSGNATGRNDVESASGIGDGKLITFRTRADINSARAPSIPTFAITGGSSEGRDFNKAGALSILSSQPSVALVTAVSGDLAVTDAESVPGEARLNHFGRRDTEAIDSVR